VIVDRPRFQTVLFAAISTPLILRSCTVDVESAPTATVVSLSGELDMADADKVAHVLAEAADCDAPVLRVDLSGLTFADSSAIKALVLGAQAAARYGIGYELMDPPERLRRLLDVTGLSGAIAVVRSES